MLRLPQKTGKILRRCIIATVCIGAVLLIASIAYETFKPPPWESAIQAFEKMDAENPPEKDGVLFVGSSSIKMWKSLEQDFPAIPVLNRGFGGSEMSDLIFFASRVILPYHPKLIIIYEGDNDIHSGKSPQTVLEDFQILIQVIQTELPSSRIAFLSIKPSPSRRGTMDTMKQANELIRKYTQTQSRVDYIDVFSLMLGSNGEPRHELFLDDGLHMNQEGYELWRQRIEDYLRHMEN